MFLLILSMLLSLLLCLEKQWHSFFCLIKDNIVIAITFVVAVDVVVVVDVAAVVVFSIHYRCRRRCCCVFSSAIVLSTKV